MFSVFCSGIRVLVEVLELDGAIREPRGLVLSSAGTGPSQEMTQQLPLGAQEFETFLGSPGPPESCAKVIWLWVKPIVPLWVGAPPILVYFSGDWDVHWGYGILTHGYLIYVFCS